MISFVGAGPGAPDLLTLRAVERLAGADVVVWAASLVNGAALRHCRAGTATFDSATMTLDDITAVYAAHPEAAIVRLHSGDPSVFGAIAEQIDWCVAEGRAYEIVPGVSSMAAAAAAAGRELTVPALAQSVIITRLANRTRASMPDHEGVAALSEHGTTMAVFLSAGRPRQLRDELLGVHSRYRLDTPAVIASRVTWPDEQVRRTTVGQLAADLEDMGVTATVMVLVGDALGSAPAPARSHVYSPTYAHTYRAVRPGRADLPGGGGEADG